MPPPPILQVAINVPLSRRFDYLAPAGQSVAIGSRVLVPFGRRDQVGLVLGLADRSEVPGNKLKAAKAVLDPTPLLSKEDLWLCQFCSDYYHHPIGEVVAAALPKLLRMGKPVYPEMDFLRATEAAETAIAGLRRAPKQAELLTALLDAGGDGLSAETLTELMPAWRRVAKPLIEKGLARRERYTAEDRQPARDLEAVAGPALNEQQLDAVAAVRAAKGFESFLINGVTGSGKTEVYLHLIADVLDRGQQVLVLVPEIGLTPQLVNRFRRRLGVEPVLMHSALNDSERLAGWRMARSGDAKLIVGTRSAVFVPLQRPGLIIVDEEHDGSLKQQEGFRYSARDLAIVRASRADIPVVLGSATPTLEMLKHCADGRYKRLDLAVRAGGAEPPSLRLVDLSRSPGQDGLSDVLLSAVSRHLVEGGQVLMFLNRRGFAPTLICGDCGHIAECRRCDARMTVHAREGLLRCHHCGASRPIDRQCNDCGAEAMRALGEGTQKLEDILTAQFPGREIRRIDSDSVQRKGAIGEALERATAGDADILVGTQMLSKGHHFPKLTLVGVINADQGLFGTDFRSSERLGQSIVQVAGRAGREERRGEVLIQTAFPENPFWDQLLDGGYDRIAAEAMHEREQAHWPPFARLALIRASAHRQSDALRFLEAAKRLAVEAAEERLRVLGPVDAPMAKRAGRFRAQLLLQAHDRQALHHCLSQLRLRLEAHPEARKVRWSIDVDPVELL
ncbi:MAG: primosomal protein N' [Woeseiaceae bacterium]|nr:primosomal protein N' [Woeseiaceae bacterium]